MPGKSAKERIEEGKWADCWLCTEVFRRRRQTARYCQWCERGFCEGEYGSFAYGKGTCLICGARKADKKLGNINKNIGGINGYVTFTRIAHYE